LDVTTYISPERLRRLYPQASDQTITSMCWWMTHLSEDPDLALQFYALFHLAHENRRQAATVEYIDGQTGVIQRIMTTGSKLPQSFISAIRALLVELEEKLVQDKPL